MTYLIEGLASDQFVHLFGQSDAELAAKHISVVYAQDDDYPCRVSLDGAAKGDRLLLVNYLHQPALSPYRASHAIYVAQGSQTAGLYHDAIPPIMQTRILSIRAFDINDMIHDADLVDGSDAETLILRLLDHEQTSYLHVHFAKRGCFAATVRRGCCRT